MSMPLPNHNAVSGECAIDNAMKIDSKHSVVLLDREVTCVTANHNGCVIENVVEATELRYDGINQPDHVIAPRDINLERSRSSAFPDDLVHRIPGGLAVDVSDDDSRSALGKLNA